MLDNNCWEVRQCTHGPDSEDPCIATQYQPADGYLNGEYGGRACFYIRGTVCENEKDMKISDKITTTCQNCSFYKDMIKREGINCNIFYYLRYIHNQAVDKNDMQIIEKVHLELFNGP